MDMKAEVVLISNETIKPSSPTPHHLRNFNFSLIDQFSAPHYVPIILFYAAAAPLDDCPTDGNQVGNDIDHRSNWLKRSLSETLRRFYPVAGRIKDNTSVDCSDEGIDYFETRINGKMSDFMTRPDAHHHLLPVQIASNILAKDAQLAVQVNVFECGGTAISFCMSHKIADASTMTSFINDWASTTRGFTKNVDPTFVSASLFPPREILETSAVPVPDMAGMENLTIGDINKAVVTKRFVFDASMIAALRAKIQDTSSRRVGYFPTRVEAVSALIWKLFMEVSKVKLESGSLTKPLKSMVVHHTVSLRKRMDQLLAGRSFGNMITLATAVASPTTVMSKHVELEELVSQLRAAISKINGDYIKNLQSGDDDDEEFLRLVNESGRFAKKVNNEDDVADHNDDSNDDNEVYWMSSWCRFPLYESDFGWGKPILVSSYQSYKNVVIMIDTRCGDGIEAWVSLVEDDMAIFERDAQLLEFASTIF